MPGYGRALVSAVAGTGVFGSVVIAGAGVSTSQTRSIAGLTSQSRTFAALFAAGRAVKDNFPAVGSANAAVGRSLD